MRVLFPVRAGLGGNPVGAAVGVQGFVSLTNYLRSAVGTLTPGNAAGFGVSVAVRINAVPTTINYMLNCNTGVSGYIVEGTAAALLRFGAADGGGVFVRTPSTTIIAGDIGNIVLLTAVHTGAGAFLRLYRAGAEVGAGTAIVGYTVATAAARVVLGSDLAGSSPTWARVLGALYFTGVPTPADILTHYNVCKAANTMENMGGAGVVNVNRWQAKDNIPNAATWVDDIGGMVLTKTGTLSSVIFNPTWE